MMNVNVYLYFTISNFFLLYLWFVANHHLHHHHLFHDDLYHYLHLHYLHGRLFLYHHLVVPLLLLFLLYS
jgi:hypothetical protein